MDENKGRNGWKMGGRMTTRGFAAETVARADAGHRCRRRTGHGDDAALSKFGAPIPVTLLSPLSS
jgi:hypothetical protein